MRVAILGAGSIARSMAATLRGMKYAGEDVELYAVGSRDAERAEQFAKREGVTRFYGSYEELLADDKIDLVYIATPHSHHAAHMRMCLERGKAVLCEKAFTGNAAQAKDVLASFEKAGLFVTEAI